VVRIFAQTRECRHVWRATCTAALQFPGRLLIAGERNGELLRPGMFANRGYAVFPAIGARRQIFPHEAPAFYPANNE